MLLPDWQSSVPHPSLLLLAQFQWPFRRGTFSATIHSVHDIGIAKSGKCQISWYVCICLFQDVRMQTFPCILGFRIRLPQLLGTAKAGEFLRCFAFDSSKSQRIGQSWWRFGRIPREEFCQAMLELRPMVPLLATGNSLGNEVLYNAGRPKVTKGGASPNFYILTN